MFILHANKNQLTVRQREPVTSGSVNVYPVRFVFSGDWEGLSKTAVFRAGTESRAVLLDGESEVGIPWEVLKKPGKTLVCGIHGTRGGEFVLPTVWASLGVIQPGAAPAEQTQPPTPDLWKQKLARKGDALEYDGLNLSLMSGETVLSSVEFTGGIGEKGDKGDPGPQGPAGSGAEIYSTEETRIGTWIDGKPLYRITYSMLTPSSAGQGVYFSVSNLSIETVVDIRGTLDSSGTLGTVPIIFPYNPSNGNPLYAVIGISADKSNVMCGIASQYYMNKPCRFSIEYTKTTDTATKTIEESPAVLAYSIPSYTTIASTASASFEVDTPKKEKV